MIDKYFKITERKSSVRTEVLAGLVTFLSMSYILVVNPSMLSQTGMDAEVLLVSTALAAAIATLIMGLYANYPIALAPGMGMNAFFTYTICMSMGYMWQDALFGVFVSGCIFILLSLTGLRKRIINSIPNTIKYATTVGIGMFIAFIGMQNAMIIIGEDSTLVSFGSILNPITILSIVGLFIILALVVKKNNYAIFIGMIAIAAIGFIITLISNIDLGVQYTGVVGMPPSIAPVFGAIFTEGSNKITLLLDPSFWLIVFSLLFVDFFDTTGTLIAVGNDANLVDDEGNLKGGSRALFADAIGTTLGAILGTSSVTSYVESVSGVNSGARTGLSAVVVGCCFLVSIFFYPLLTLVGVYVTAPVLIVVGTLMALNNNKIDYSDYVEATTAFVVIAITTLAYSISSGIAAGFIVYVFMKLFQGKSKEISGMTYALAILFLVKLLFPLIIYLGNILF